MKIFFIIALSAISLSCLAQDNLKLSRAIYFPFVSEESHGFIAKDTVLIIPKGKVWKITNTKVSMTYDNRIIHDKTYLCIGEQIITYSNESIVQKSDPLWLPSGKYRITIRTEEENQEKGRFNYNAFISGVEYDLYP